ncbi:hypothetical protein COR50_07730 [Chitinophaga caeni]|uniref:Tetratricopeptide repeat protein n=1 Tax=Chitinophaga caeni TaxID=2029983 RepID=A0A291QTB7_9BACT|nr:hypothetical protein [Chitinophaga caeni]ATL47084.1 hypothetical protein COR50_07730 [Chitinophaga caeni]
MRKFIFAICFSLLGLQAVYAQNNYQSTMEKLVTQLDTTKMSGEQYLQMANTFDRIAAAEQGEWLPNYYAAYCRIMLAFSEKDPEKIDALSDAAELNLDKAELVKPGNSEVNCLRSMIASARIGVDPMTRGQVYGPKSAEYLASAKAEDPGNPRVYFLLGQSLYYTPEAFGGDKAKAKQLYELSLEKFETFKPESKIHPHWGEEYVKGLVKTLKF